MTRRKTFREADVSRALKAAQSVGLSIARVEIDQAGKIVIVSGRPADDEPGDRHVPSDALEALRRRNAQRRAERLALRQAFVSPRFVGSGRVAPV